MLVRWLSPLLAIPLLAATCGPGTSHPDRQVAPAEIAVQVPSASAPGGSYTLLVDATEVTQREYLALVGRNPSYHADCPDCPVERVSWYDAAAYANAKSRAEGRTPCYEFVSCTTPDDGSDRRRRRGGPSPMRCASATSLGPTCDGHRLPTRAESDAFRRPDPMLASRRSARQYAIYGRGGSQGPSAVVGSLAADPLGLYDVFGNVDEWLDDPATVPASARGAAADESRWQGTAGGCALSSLRTLRATTSVAAPAAFARNCLGFRLVRTR